ncbi:MAG: class I adenylate-forming enzyme family protein [Dehalococcoidia bacterium]
MTDAVVGVAAPSTGPEALDAHGSMAELFRATASQYHSKTAIVYDETRLTWGDVERAVAGRMARLAQLEVTSGDAVVLLLPNTPAFAITFLATISLGAVAVPLNPAYVPEEVARYIRNASASCVVTTDEIAGRLRDALSVSGVKILVTERHGCEDSGTAEASFPPVTLDTVALYGYSSGSTGEPKRVSRTHRNLIAESAGFTATVGVTSDDVVLAVVPLFHAHGLGNALMAAVRSGATLVMEEEFRRRPVLDLIARERVTVFPGVPFIFDALADTKPSGVTDLTSLRLCFSAGAHLSPEIHRKFLDRHGAHVRQLYGCTEAGSVTINLDDDPTESVLSVGRPIGHGRVEVRDEDGRVCAPGVTGEIAISSPTLTQAYDGMEEATRESFKDGWFITGDLGHLDGTGALYVTGRKKIFISTAGNKVDPVEVEQVIAQHKDVSEVVVVGVTGPAGGGETVKAVVVAIGPCDRAEIIAFCRERLAEFKVPRIVEFRDAIPKNPLGKVLRKYLV